MSSCDGVFHVGVGLYGCWIEVRKMMADTLFRYELK